MSALGSHTSAVQCTWVCTFAYSHPHSPLLQLSAAAVSLLKQNDVSLVLLAVVFYTGKTVREEHRLSGTTLCYGCNTPHQDNCLSVCAHTCDFFPNP